MKKSIFFILSLFVLLNLDISIAATNLPKNTTQKIVMKGSTPAGVAVKKNKVTLKPGYIFSRVSDSTATVMAKKRKDGTSGPISGEFTCGCQTNGSCKLMIDGTSIWCYADTCGSSCQMTVTIPSKVNVIQ